MGTSGPEFALDIDIENYQLSIVRDGDVIRSFSVGLGRDDSTPRGEFRVVNKILDPAWYNDGDVVAADDPRNPLGGIWMGLGDAHKATTYGIHATTDPESIGTASTEGCVRMTPQDAELVFRLCPIGTRVTIR
jgi:lipoprotein-anchoring transpeptidase ErfK/SrfK